MSAYKCCSKVAFFLLLSSYMAFSSHSLFRTEIKAKFSNMTNRYKGIPIVVNNKSKHAQ